MNLILAVLASVTTYLRDCFTGLEKQEKLAVVKVATEFEDWVEYISGCRRLRNTASYISSMRREHHFLCFPEKIEQDIGVSMKHVKVHKKIDHHYFLYIFHQFYVSDIN